MMQGRKSGVGIEIVANPMPEPALLDGVCFRPRDPTFPVDVLILHTCYVPEKLRAAGVSAAAGGATITTGDSSAKELGKRWRESGAASDENLAIYALIMGRLGEDGFARYNVASVKAMFEFYGVSAHYVVDREARIHELVPPSLLAFHAGKSKLPSDGREALNNYSIGVELLCGEDESPTAAQVVALARLTEFLMQSYPIEAIYGHSDIAPGRKTDPWNFSWPGYLEMLSRKPRHHPG
jgi:hypothetical protein